MTVQHTRVLRLTAGVLVLAAVAFFVPFWPSLVLAAWLADLLAPVQRWCDRALHGRRRAAVTLVVLVAILVLLPLVGATLAIGPRLLEAIEQLRAALLKGSFYGSLLGERDNRADLASLATRYAGNGWRALTMVARASATVTIAAVVFVAALYTFLAYGTRAYAWAAAHAPVPRDAFDRLAGAFRETGRGLIVAGGGTALVQGAVATVAYVAIGIPRALILGLLTGVCTLIPAVGTAVVWLPLAVGLASGGEYGRAALLTAAGILVSVIDNLTRPVLARYGQLALPTFVVLVSMLGGVTLLGPAGALLGPLAVRLAVESVALLREEPTP